MNANFTARFLQADQNSRVQFLRSVRSFFGFRISGMHHGSRIVRRQNRSYEEFIFKGYHVEKQDAAGTAPFKAFRFLWKN